MRSLLISMVCVSLYGQSALPLPQTGNVTLSLDEYNRLIELAATQPKRPDAPPLAYAMQSADLKVRVTGESATAAIQLAGEVFAQGATKVALTSGMTIVDAQRQGKELSLAREGAAHTTVIDGPSEFSLALTAALGIAIEPGRASLALPVPVAGTARLSLTLPGEHTNISLNPGLITQRTSAAGNTTIEATLVPGQATSISWATRDNTPPAPPKEVRVLSDVKSLISVSEAQVSVAALTEVTVVQGEPAQFEFDIPAGYEVTGATGASLSSSDQQGRVLVLKVSNATLRSHQFLISMERSLAATKVDVPLLRLKNAQRETGEALVEGTGTMELTATESGGLKRMDVKEISPYLRALAHNPMQAAFRYHSQPADMPSLALEWVRFPDSRVLAAVAQRAVVTTLVTSEGRSLTEVKLTLRNQAQLFLKVALPAGSTIVSADVAGEKVKPVEGPDGARVPLLRPGFRPVDTYTVSFVFLHSGSPFAKKGGSDLTLPKMDVPVSLLEWEVFLPERYKVTDFGGDAVPAALMPYTDTGEDLGEFTRFESFGRLVRDDEVLMAGQLGGVVVDPAGAVIPYAQVVVTHKGTGLTLKAQSDQSGRWVVSGMPSGQVSIKVDRPGFTTLVRWVEYQAGRPVRYNLRLNVGSVSETVEVMASAMVVQTENAELSTRQPSAKQETQKDVPAPASANVVNLQQRVAGVLPIRVDVPHAGRSFRFMRPLVVEEETKVTFAYKTR